MKTSIDLYNDNIGKVSLVDSMGDDARAVNAARVSFLKDDIRSTPQGPLNDKDAKLIKFLLRHQHTSPFEHSSLSVRVKVPLFIRSQIMRHRTFSYNEVSRRYTNENIEFHIPHTLRQQSKSNLQCSTEDAVFNNSALIKTMQNQVNSAYLTYQKLLDGGVAREQARAVLPQNMYTSFYMTGNLLNWIKFLRLRLDPHAQPEIQELGYAVLTILKEVFPHTAEILKELDVL
jgi:thymidylate synthase (FAD)